MLCRDQGRAVARDARLGRQRVHRLRAGDARDELHRKRAHAAVGQARDELRPAERCELADEEAPAREPVGLVVRGRRDAHDHVRRGVQRAGLDRFRARVRVLGVGVEGGLAGAELDEHARAVGDERAGGLRRERHAALAGQRLARDADRDPSLVWIRHGPGA